ncbi:MAG: exopolysaccharide biosynthesis polyprenyl glycosylphosphotransferase, partial [Nocardioidaceae bacterium]
LTVAAIVPATGPNVLVAVGAGVILVTDYARLTPAQRQSSWRPMQDLAILGGGAHLLAAMAGWASPAGLRASFAVLAASLGVVGVSVVARRLPVRTRSVMLVGDRLAVAQCVEHWMPRADTDIRGVALVEPPLDASDRPADVLGVPVIGDLGDAPRLAVEAGIDEVIVAPGPLVTAYDVRRLSWALERTPVQVGVTAEVHGAAPHRIRPRLIGRRVVLSVEPSARPRLLRVLKVVIDRAGGVLLLGMFAPLIGLLCLLVRLDSRGSVLFRQVRMGAGGAPFTMFKLRTMCTDAEDRLAELRDHNEGAGPLFKMSDDPRVTRIGRMLRRTSLDELPQLINVVRGEMSLIGPRPSLPTEAERYDDWVSRRLAVKPGMTGMWQVSGRSRLSWDETVGLDLGYVDNWTLGGDLVIAAKTLKAVVRSDGAA